MVELGAVVVVVEVSFCTVALPNGVVAVVVVVDSCVVTGGVVGVVTTVVVSLAGAVGTVTVVLDVVEAGRSHPARAAAARTRAVATGTSFFMGFSVRDVMG